MTRKKKIILVLAVVMAIVLAMGITLAFMFKKSETVENEFVPASVTCEVDELFDGTHKNSIKIRNTGNTKAYLCVKLISYWVDGDGNIVGKTSEMPEVSFDDVNWVQGSDDVYYYVEPVDPETETVNDLLISPIVLREDSYNGYTVYQVVEVFAEAIQSAPKNAAENSWNVNISKDGKITGEK